MLGGLSIRNLAIVTSVELELRDGMVVLTGETGAGKSILIDALSLALGDKTDKRMIRHGEQRAEVSASFQIDSGMPISAWLREHELDADDECILRRVLNQNGRSRAFINGSPVPQKVLQQAGGLLVAVHGQHAHQSLVRGSHQRQLLDRFGALTKLAARVERLYREIQTVRAELDEKLATRQERLARRDLLNYQIDELQALALDENEWRQLDAEQTRLSSSDRLRNGSAAILDALKGEETSLHDALAANLGRLTELAASDPKLGEPCELLESALIQIEETANSLRHYLDGLNLDPQRLDEVEKRLGLLLDMARKYRVKPEELGSHLDGLQAELASLEAKDTSTEHLKDTLSALQQDYATNAEKLTKKRRSAARRLATRVTEFMQTLAMRGGLFDIRLSPAQAGPGGQDKIEFLVSANPGQPLEPLGAVASGGELSRISLAIQTATAGCDDIPTLIFDEVDVGIGGGTASIVGGLLRKLASERQVVCITHLPQVAAFGQQHLAVTKSSRAGQTTTGILPLNAEQRIEELARMLGGAEITEKTRDNARELLRQAASASRSG
ncbi:MAG TPA: DNA repair protein RecN [Chromatiaceae bacterium]|nr:DNA repair protein RecN [Chromatiaceae bacterium]